MNAIRYMARNHVAANILMAILIVGGLMAVRGLTVEVFPEIDMDTVSVTVPYPGAGPEEIEDGIIRPIEEAVRGLDGIKKMTASAQEGVGSVVLQVLEGYKVDNVLQDIKAAVDRIIIFPKQAERPVVQKLMRRRAVLSVVLYGKMDTSVLRARGEALQDDLLALEEITQVEMKGVPPYEISVEVSEANLRRYGLTLDRLAASISAASLDLPSGEVKTKSEGVLLRTKERRYWAKGYEKIVVVSKPDGTLVRLGDIAKEVKETFAETEEKSLFDGHPAVMVEVYRVGDETPTKISKAVHNFIKKHQKRLPPGIKLAIWNDTSEILEARMNLLTKNAFLGLILVLVVLGIFLQVRLAFWVTLGIPLSMIGALIILPWMGVTINMITLFAFIVVLGIVVDDAIVVGENIFTYRSRGHSAQEAAELGTLEVARPVTFSILTTVAAFAPLLFVAGVMGKFWYSIPVIVISVLMISLIESLFILPAHLSGSRDRDYSKSKNPLARLHHGFGVLVQRFINGPYSRFLALCLRYRYATLALALVMIALTFGLFKGGHLRMIMMPEVEGNVVRGKLVMPFGTPAAETEKHLRFMLKSAQKLVRHYDRNMPKGSILRNIYILVGGHLRTRGPHGGAGTAASHLGEIAVFLHEADKRNVSAEAFTRRWRDMVGEIAGTESLTFDSSLMSMGAPIDIQLAHEDFKVLNDSGEKVKEALRQYPGVYDITDSHKAGKRELKLKLKPYARALGITQTDLARQVRAAFYGAEALRLQRKRNEVKVMVRYPIEERRSLANLENLRIRTPQGGEVPFRRAAAIEEGRGYSDIQRVEQKRTINITAMVNFRLANPREIIGNLKETLLRRLVDDTPGLTFDVEGRQKEMQESMSSMMKNFLVAIFVIFALLAIPFKSYSQPLIIMTAIPFGVIGAIIGHMIMGFNVSMLSMAGVVALSGVVINDSLVLIDFINRNRQFQQSTYLAIIEGATRRFRPIILTTLTTFFALIPMLAEKSLQARFLIPMAISLAFGVLFATLITLVIIPAFYMILDDIQRGLSWVLGRPSPSENRAAEAQLADAPAPGTGNPAPPAALAADTSLAPVLAEPKPESE